LTRLAARERDYPAAVDYARRLLRHDPLHEPAYRRLMRLLALTGDRAGSLQTYHTCATFLRREVDVEPGPETQQLYAQLLAQESATPPPIETGPVGTAGPMVGRTEPWGLLRKLWREESQVAPQWALISGEAGMGKSRLAEEMMAWA